MNILALDTTTEMCSVALMIKRVVYENSIITSQGHSDHILNMIDLLLVEAETSLSTIDLLAFGKGPGSFTGLRIGIGIAQGIAFAQDIPAIPISSLAAIAQSHESRKSLVAIDARMGEVYWGVYEKKDSGLAVLRGNELVCSPQKAPCVQGSDWLGLGSGWKSYKDQLATRFNKSVIGWNSECYPRASAIATLGVNAFIHGKSVIAEEILPTYIRNQVVKN
ncbi:tRNA (adenosine(37)-N6)-threonylcarbamoyltransferase complex dimerization subunit type 1 TsaB [Candidatus Nitrosacidococcus sp. I8]|uniref:tRNA (adenosine(37)-N6)-threonylcarbamoyltransferase complex dimerization subunit type 1 TsaB n=1 Tax=Candidatus Nitrosacidococcus sp. I8 TaxID=2942908 RepID=UPI00222802BF|nr:tRNA (adenosine(37)-N6)-threonylcarbamoyltransferase complex dimerization subunit type 1 TsaB [Candidatus Nitrosacidococcus sp. I8]CAH9018809.1 tRNA threonylcarbamoyladenosine biosynthesis protein TsaB [Candidatus Nitrosacidococcus sp. I8]